MQQVSISDKVLDFVFNIFNIKRSIILFYFICNRRGSTRRPTSEHLRDGACSGLRTEDENFVESIQETSANEAPDAARQSSINSTLSETTLGRTASENPVNNTSEKNKPSTNNGKNEIPECDCFPTDKNPPEPGNYYTQLGISIIISIYSK